MYYDTIKGWLPNASMGCDATDIVNCLHNVSETINARQEHSFSGHLENFKITISEAGIFFHGSLPKLLHGNNFEPFTLHDTKCAIEKFSDMLHVPFKEAILNRIDLGYNIETQYKPEVYYPSLGNKARFVRVSLTENSLYYKTQQRQLLFYDKTQEAKCKKTAIPEMYTDKNILRYEMQLLKAVSKQLKESNITANMLCNEAFYRKATTLWANEYFSIEKVNRTINLDYSKIQKPSDVKEALLASFLTTDIIDTTIQTLKARNIFDDPKYYSRVKQTLTQSQKKASSTEKNELITELNKKVNTVLQYCQ